MYVDSIQKSFGTRQVLTDVYLTCKPGEIIGLLGRNGSGKSTLLKIIFGTLSADQKFVRIGNRIIRGVYDNRQLVSYLPQDHFLPNHIRVSAMISLLCDKKNRSLLLGNDLFKPMLGKKSGQLSGGEKRLLEIYLIIHSNARYVLIDEPFNGIEPLHKEGIKNLIREQAKDKGFIITDHDFRNILDIATRTVLVHDGGAREIRSREELQLRGYLPRSD